MALPVDVSSIDVLRDVRESLILFGEDAKNALGQMEMEIRHCIDWLTHDQRIHWQTEIKKRKEKLSEAKAELGRKQMGKSAGGNAHDSEQREMVRVAKHRLEEAEETLEKVKRWIPELERAVMEYDGVARAFADMLEGDLEKSTGIMERMINALDEYIRINPPETTSAPSASMGSGGSASVVSTASTPAAAAAKPVETKS